MAQAPSGRASRPIMADVAQLAGVSHQTVSRVPSVAIDNVAGALAATRYLLGLGHRTVHHLAGPACSQDAEERVDGWDRALAAAGGPRCEPLRGDWSARSGYDLAHQIARLPSPELVVRTSATRPGP